MMVRCMRADREWQAVAIHGVTLCALWREAAGPSLSRRLPSGIELTFLNYALVRLVSTFDSILKFGAGCRQELHDLIDSVLCPERKCAVHVLADPKFVVAHAVCSQSYRRLKPGTPKRGECCGPLGAPKRRRLLGAAMPPSLRRRKKHAPT